MFKLVTGKPGDGKTSNELWEFLHAKEYKGRDKFCTPIKGFEAAKHGVTEIEDIKGWRDLPDGSVIFIDEVQDYLGQRSGKEVPEWIRELARHRHSGKDFIATTQDPMFLDPFVRKLAKPHVHYHRPWNMKMVRHQWDTVQNDPTNKTARKSSQSRFVKPNPEVFKLYTSTVLDTHKAAPPWKLIAVAVLALVCLLGGSGMAVMRLLDMGDKAEPDALEASDVVVIDGTPASRTPLDGITQKPAITSEASWEPDKLTPRIEGMPWSAPIYDHLTRPNDFPRVAACISSERTGCRCFTQQGTPLNTPEKACEVLVKQGAFDPWKQGRQAVQNNGSGDRGPSAANNEPPAEPSGAITQVRYEKGRFLW